MGTASSAAKAGGIVLIVVVGLLNFHVPHFLIERATQDGTAANVLELALLANVMGAAIAALGIYRDQPWAWVLGVVVAGISLALYLVQETVGLPGLPKMWLEPSRLVSLVLEGVFVVLACVQIVRISRRAPGG